MSVSRVGQMQQGKATSWRGQGKNTGTLVGGECWPYWRYLSFTEDVGTSADIHTHICTGPNMHGEINPYTHLSILFSWQEVSNECGTQKTLERKQGRSHSYHWLCRARRGPPMSAFRKITRLKSRLQTSALCQGLRVVFMSPCRCLTETRKVGSEGVLVTVAGTVMGPFLTRQYPHYPSLYLLCLYWCAPGTLSWYPTHTVSVLWPHSSDCINSDYGRIILVCLAIKYAHVWLSRAASQALIGTSPSPI